MAIQIPQSQVSIPVQRPVLPDPGTASLLYRQGAQGAQQLSQGALQSLHYLQYKDNQENAHEYALNMQRRKAAIAYHADEAVLGFDRDMQTMLRDTSQQYADNPEEFYKRVPEIIKERATFHSMNRETPDGVTQRFENDPEAAADVRGDLLDKGREYLKQANAITTQMTVSKGLATIAEAEDMRLNLARQAQSPEELGRVIGDMAQTYGRHAGTTISGQEATKSAVGFADKASLAFYDQQAQSNPDAFLVRVSSLRPSIKTDEGMKQYRENNYRGIIANINKTSEVTLLNALNVGNIDVSHYNAALKAKGMGPEYVADRMYTASLLDIEKGNAPIHALPSKMEEWSSLGIPADKINLLRSAALNFHDRMVSFGDRAQKQGEDVAKQKAQVLESKIYDMLDKGQIKSVDQILPMLQDSVEATGMTADHKERIKTNVRNSIGVEGPGDPHLKNVWELDIRSGNKPHSSDEIRSNKTMNLDQKNDLQKILKEEAANGGMRPEDKAVYDEYKKKVALVYGEKGLMANYSLGEAQVLATALSRYSELVRNHKMHPRDAADKVRTEMNVTSTGKLYGGALPDLNRVLDLAKRRAAKTPTGVSDDTLDFWISQYKQKTLVESVFPKIDAMQGIEDKPKK